MKGKINKVLPFVRENPGCTQKQISQGLKITYQPQVNTRLRELITAGLIYRNESNRPYRCYPTENTLTEIEVLRVSQRNNQRAIILKGKGQERYLPVRVEPAEADAIEFKLKNVATPRPLTHDLLCSLIQAFGGKVRLAVIHDVHKDTFFAKLVVEVRRKNFEFDCCPADAIAVALIAKAPICVEKTILDKFGTTIDQMGEYKRIVMATYKQIQDWVREHYGFTLITGWIAHVKEMHCLPLREAPNRPKGTQRKNSCPSAKVKPIEQAFRHFGMIP